MNAASDGRTCSRRPWPRCGLRRRPAQLSYASFGIGSASHLYGAMLETVADVRMVHVPYRGSAPAVLDVVAGNAFLSINDEAVTVPQVRDGRLLPLAVTGPARIDTLPEVPTFVELGYRGGLELLGYNGLVLRSGTPPALVERLAAAILPVGKLADYSNAGTLFAFMMVAISVMVLRKTDPARRRPFRTPAPGAPGAGVPTGRRRGRCDARAPGCAGSGPGAPAR